MGIFGSIGNAISGAFGAVTGAVSDATSKTFNVAKTGLEYLASGDHYLYSHAVARPLSTFEQQFSDTGLGTLSPNRTLVALVHGKNPLAHVNLGNFGSDLTQGWDQSWKRSSYISPGQAGYLAADPTYDANKVDLNDPKSVEAYFSHGVQKYVSGASDFTANWFLDPLVLAGKVTKGVRAAGEIDNLAQKATRDLVKGTGEKRSPTPAERSQGWNLALDKSADGGKIQKIIKSTDGRDANGILQYNWARQGTNAPLLAHAMATAGSDAAKGDVIKLAMGDTRALNTLQEKNAQLASDIETATDRWSSLNKNLPALNPGSTAWNLAKARLDDYSATLYALDKQYGTVTDQLKLWNTMDKANIGLGSNAAATVRGVRYGVIQPNIYQRPLLIARSLSNKMPTGVVDLNDNGSIKEVEAWLGRAKELSPDTRNRMLSDYAQAGDKAAKAQLLPGIEKKAMDDIAIARGMTPEEASKIHAGWKAQSQMTMDESNRYSAAQFIDDSGQKINVDTFQDGQGVAIHPNLKSKLQRSYTLTDLDEYRQALKVHGDGLKTLMRAGTSAENLATAMIDRFQSYWKLGVFARLGFPVRNVSDDLFGQLARFGAFSMATRMGHGASNLISNRIGRSTSLLNETEKALWENNHIDLNETKGLIEQHIQNLQDAKAIAPSIVHDDHMKAAVNQLDMVKQQIADNQSRLDAATAKHAAGQARIDVNGIRMPGAFEGEAGGMYRKLVSADNNQMNMIGKAAEDLHDLTRAGHWEILSAAADEGRHLTYWEHIGKHQLGEDALGRRVVAGQSKAQVQRWLMQTGEGRQYWKDLGLKNENSGSLYDRTKAEVDQYFPEDVPGLRQAILDGSLNQDLLKQAIPNPAARPNIHAGRMEFNSGKHWLAKKVDAGVNQFYKYLATLPQDTLSKNPLFAQQYEAHAKRMMNLAVAQRGDTHFSVDDINAIADKARAFAKRDTLRYSADMMHKSSAASHLRVISPFFNATQEAFMRWSRIVHDVPEAAPRMAQFFQAPSAMGLVVDSNGNKVDAEGYATDPSTGKRYLVPQSQRIINLGKHVFPWLSSGAKIGIPQDSANIIFQGQPAGNPGYGPIVQVAANQLLKDKPGAADIAQQIGLLPNGVSSRGIADQFMPGSIRALKDYLVSDESDQQWQATYLGVMQSEYAKHANGWRPTPADLKEIKARTKQYFGFKAVTSLLAPVSMNEKDPYQYLRNEYKNMLAADPKSADQKFYDKYGDALFVFTASQSKKNAAVPATKEGYAAFQKYRDLIQQDPTMAGLIIGDQGNGSFDTNAYQAELATAIGGPWAEKIRGKQSPGDAIAEAKTNEGWTMYNKYMTQIKAQLTDRGLTDLTKAPDLQNMKRALVMALSDEKSPYYNPDWAKAYDTLQPQKYEQMIPSLEKIAADPLIKNRDDIRGLNEYLSGRAGITQILDARRKQGGSATLSAQSNQDLYQAWQGFVGTLTEKNLAFETLYNRYLPRDMGVSI